MNPASLSSSIFHSKNHPKYAISHPVAEINSAFGTDLQLVGSDGVINAKNLMALLVLGFKPTESLGLEAGVGYVGYETDSYQGVKIKNNYLEYYLQAVINMAKGVYIIPEIGYHDFGTQKVDTPFFIVAPRYQSGQPVLHQCQVADRFIVSFH